MTPLVYEINTRCWLWELSERHATRVTLANVPDSEFVRWRELGFTHLWLMGVWTIGPRTVSFSRNLADVRTAPAKLLPDFSEEDIVGSPYAIAGYKVAENLDGEAGLAEFRKRLHSHGLKLILDFIPNHVGLDHAWLESEPQLFVQSANRKPGTFQQQTRGGPVWIAHGKDPYFPAWADTAQLDYRNSATHLAMMDELEGVSRLCDGVRCDMAMLVLNEVFTRNWMSFPGANRLAPPTTEFWVKGISRIRAKRPDFLFLAEAYWDLEARLVELGFDFAYDKRLTDHIVARRPPEVQRHLFASIHSATAVPAVPPRVSPANPATAAHFLENHDEPRAASLLPLDEHRAAALLILSLPGMRLLHQGQLTGAKERASVHLRRSCPEPPQPDITSFYELLLATLQKTSIGRGKAEFLEPRAAWEGNPTANNVILIQWQSVPTEFDVAAINLASHPSQCYVTLAVEGLASSEWEMADLLGQECHQRSGAELAQNGLFLDLAPHAAQLFHFAPVD